MRTCKTCLQEKDESEFSKDRVNRKDYAYVKKNGTVEVIRQKKYKIHVCKECTKKRERDLYERTKEKRRKWKKEFYHENKERLIPHNALKMKKWIEKNPEKFKAQKRRYYKNNKEKIQAKDMVFRAIQNGEIVKPDRCQSCSKVGYVEGHHHNYEFPLEVTFVCRRCHAGLHMMIREQEKT